VSDDKSEKANNVVVVDLAESTAIPHTDQESYDDFGDFSAVFTENSNDRVSDNNSIKNASAEDSNLPHTRQEAEQATGDKSKSFPEVYNDNSVEENNNGFVDPNRAKKFAESDDNFGEFSAVFTENSNEEKIDRKNKMIESGSRIDSNHVEENMDNKFGNVFISQPQILNGNAEETKSGKAGVEDWDAFEEAPKNSDSLNYDGLESMEGIRSQLEVLWSRMPTHFVNLSPSLIFDGNLGTKKKISNLFSHPYSDIVMQRLKRSFRIVSLLVSSHQSLISKAWNPLLANAQEELVNGTSILLRAKGLCQDARKEVKECLQVMVLGLAEYVRVVRSIVGTIGDILCLDTSSMLLKHNLDSDWGGIDLIKIAMEVEDSWETIESFSGALNLSLPSTLESLQNIRSDTLNMERKPLCQLTLQPLSGIINSTRATVNWEGQLFMACAANFYANRISMTQP